MQHKNFFVVEEDTNLYNIFAQDDFDADGFYMGHKEEDGYHLSDFEDDIVFESDSFDECVAWVDKQLGYE